MQGWLQDALPPVLSGAILAALQAKGVSADELSGMATVLLQQSVASGVAMPTPLIDTCGTGGDGASTFNISTAVAFTAAAAGIPVAKHGNRSASSRVGSADVLEALGINLAAPTRKNSGCCSRSRDYIFVCSWLAPRHESSGAPAQNPKSTHHLQFIGTL